MIFQTAYQNGMRACMVFLKWQQQQIQNSRTLNWYGAKNAETKNKQTNTEQREKNLNTFISSFIRQDSKHENCLSLSACIERDVKKTRWIAIEH